MSKLLYFTNYFAGVNCMSGNRGCAHGTLQLTGIGGAGLGGGEDRNGEKRREQKETVVVVYDVPFLFTLACIYLVPNLG